MASGFQVVPAAHNVLRSRGDCEGSGDADGRRPLITGIGYVRLDDGRLFVWARSALWLITCPIILMQISEMGKIQFRGMDLGRLQIPVSVVMIVMGVSATLSTDEGVKWM